MAMLDAEEIRSLILCRVIAALDSCNSHHINHCEGQIRALVAVLTGAVPPSFSNMAEILDAAGIPYERREGNWIEYDDEWLSAHGFEVEDDSVTHPRFSEGW